MRPPYGDIDDRVRYISLRMGLRPVIWTVYNGQTFGKLSLLLLQHYPSCGLIVLPTPRYS